MIGGRREFFVVVVHYTNTLARTPQIAAAGTTTLYMRSRYNITPVTTEQQQEGPQKLAREHEKKIIIVPLSS